MDILQDLALQALALYRHSLPYLLPFLRQFYTIQYRLQTQLLPLVTPYLNILYLWAHESPAIISVGALLLFFLIVMQIMNFFRRIMMFWVRLMWRVAFWGAVVGIGAVVYERGLESTIADLVGWGRQLAEVWWREYEGYQRAGSSESFNKQGDYGQGGYGARNSAAGGGKSNWR